MHLSSFPNETPFIFHHDINRKIVGELIGPPHYHNFFEIYYIESGKCSYFIDNKSHQLQTGDVVLVPEGVIHNTFYKDVEYSRMLINCSRRFIPTAVMPYLPSMLYLYRNPDVADTIYSIFKSIEAEYQKNDALSQESLNCYTQMLFYTMARNPNTYDNKKKSNRYTADAIRYMQKNFTKDLSLPEVSRHFFINPKYLTRLLKKETGFGFSEYLNLLRLQYAETLLQQSDKLSISEISEQCGFHDSNYFCVKFKKQYGVSPKKRQQELRRSLHKQKENPPQE